MNDLRKLERFIGRGIDDVAPDGTATGGTVALTVAVAGS
mgnify:CR=1 FL=1